VVTGGGRGLGAAIAAELARLGASLSLLGRGLPELDEVATRLSQEHGVDTVAVECDVSDGASVSSAFGTLRTRADDPYILVNNAGQAEGAPFTDTDRELWERMLAVNLTAHYLCAQQVLPAMIARRAGRIVNIASTAGLKGYAGTTAYTASKHGVIGLTRALALETAKLGVTVNAVCPGYAETEMSERAAANIASATGRTLEEARERLRRTNPRGTLIKPEEVANAVAWLCSPDAGAITGQAIVVAAGEI
jgi:NAD(P)-dependent dehydrogenase (short-subunit alcohol dehydrogenase family)